MVTASITEQEMNLNDEKPTLHTKKIEIHLLLLGSAVSRNWAASTHQDFAHRLPIPVYDLEVLSLKAISLPLVLQLASTVNDQPL